MIRSTEKDAEDTELYEVLDIAARCDVVLVKVSCVGFWVLVEVEVEVELVKLWGAMRKMAGRK